MNERTHFFIKIYLSHFILESVYVSCVREVSRRRGQTATYWPKVLLTIAALFLILAWVTQPWDTEGRKPSVYKLILTLASCPPTDPNSNWNWHKPSKASGYIIVLRSPASTVPPLIYTGASLDRWLGRGSIYNNIRLGFLEVVENKWVLDVVSINLVIRNIQISEKWSKSHKKSIGMLFRIKNTMISISKMQ